MAQKGSWRFGQYLKQLREERRLTLDQVEERSLPLRPRISKAWLSRCENGFKEPSIDRLSVLSKIYQTSIGHLVDRREIEAELESIAPIDVSGSTFEELRQLGMEFVERGELKAGFAYFRASEERAVLESGDFRSANVAKARLNMAIALGRMAKYQLAKEEAESSLALMERDAPDRFRALLLVTICHQKQGNPMMASVILETLYPKLEHMDLKDRADLVLFRGNVQFDWGEHREAIKSYRQAASLYKSAKNLAGQYRALKNAANSYGKLGQYERAIREGLRALELSRRADDKQANARILQALGSLYYLAGSVKEAKKLLYESVELARRGDYHDTLFGSYFYLWRMEGQKGRPGAATLERAMRNLLPKLDEKLEEAEAFRKLMEERKNAKS